MNSTPSTAPSKANTCEPTSTPIYPPAKSSSTTSFSKPPAPKPTKPKTRPSNRQRQGQLVRDNYSLTTLPNSSTSPKFPLHVVYITPSTPATFFAASSHCLTCPTGAS